MQSTQTFFAAKYFDGYTIRSDAYIEVVEGTIHAIKQQCEAQDIIVLNGLVSAGFIDVQVNGGGGYLFNAKPSLEAIQAMVNTHRQFGTTCLLPTLITDQALVIKEAADAVACAIESKLPEVAGVHFEGPHLSVTKRGIHPEAFIRAPSDTELAQYCRSDIGQVVLTVAPEQVSASFIKELVDEGVIVCLGHSNASYEKVEAALKAGATGFTHLFNAMSPMLGREPGMVGAALLNTNSYCGLIVDLHHVHPASCKLAIKTKTASKTLLVTDAMQAVGAKGERFGYFDSLIVRRGSKLTLEDGTLAGSVLDMATAVRNCHQVLELPLNDALQMATSTPANFLGLEAQGRIIEGAAANFVVLDEQLTVQQTWVAGCKQWDQV